MITFTCDVCGESVSTDRFTASDNIDAPRDWIVRHIANYTGVLFCSVGCAKQYNKHATWRPGKEMAKVLEGKDAKCET